jgi:hypothetical protein
MLTLAQIVVRLVEDALRWLMLLARSTEAVRAENLLLRRQLALFLERGEPAVGRRTDCQRAAAQAAHSDLAKDSAKVLA